MINSLQTKDPLYRTRHRKILSEIWDSEMFVEENTLNVTISRVRKKLKELESDLKVITVRGMGYKVEYEG